MYESGAGLALLYISLVIQCGIIFKIGFCKVTSSVMALDEFVTTQLAASFPASRRWVRSVKMEN